MAGTLQDAESNMLVAFGGGANCLATDVATACGAHPGGYRLDFRTETFIAHALRGEGFDGSEDGTGRGTPLVPVSFAENVRGEVRVSHVTGALSSGGGKPGQGYPAIAFGWQNSEHQGDSASDSASDKVTPTLDKSKVPAVAFKAGQGSKAGSIGYQEETAPTLGAADSGSNRTPAMMQGMQVRRLTPTECERLQGFPDGYTAIEIKSKPAADGPRYKALGNSMAVPCMRWLGERIEQVNKI